MSVLPKRSYLISDLVASATRFDGSSVSYGYDARANLAFVAYPDDTLRFTWDGDGLQTSAANAAGTVTNVHDAATGWLNTSRGVDGTAVLYTRSDGGAVTSVVSVAGTTAYALDRAYAYDALDRLAADGPVSHAYDAADNRTAKTGDVEGDVTYTRGVGDRLASWTGGAYTYDAAGNVTRIVRDGRPTLDLTWNGQYQLVSVSTNGVFAEGYAYDALGRRASTTTLEGMVRHVYDDNWQVIADLDSNGNVLRSYVWGEGVDRLLAVKVGAKSYAALTDVQGTVWGLADGMDVVARWTYDAWGNVLSGEVIDPALTAFRYRFQGREFSSATGLTNFRARWYDPGTGRWLSKDPIGLTGGINLYAFCQLDPMNNGDVLGWCPKRPTRTRRVSYGSGRIAAVIGVLYDISLVIDSEENVGIAVTGGIGFGMDVGVGIPGTSVSSSDGRIYDQGGFGVEGHVGIVGGISFDPTASNSGGVVTGWEIGNIGGGVYGTGTLIIPVN